MRTLAVIACFVLLAAAPSRAQNNWQLIWSDEFNGEANSPADASKWTYDTGATGWGNNELETYTKDLANAHMDGNGHLVIHVESPSKDVYTSARLKTQGLFTVQLGRIEARIKLPFGQGIWPAFWMLGSNIDKVNWPQCGEIDIMENIGKTPSTAYGSVHAPDFDKTGQYALSNGQKLSDNFHTFAVQWSADTITFFVDGTSYETVKKSDASSSWVFNDSPFFLLLNVAVGGNWPGPPDQSTTFPQEMLVDYVRVYQTTSKAAPAINAPNGVADGASYGPALAPGSLASAFGPSLANTTDANLFDTKTGAFSTSSSGVSVFVNGVPAALIYLGPGQINFAIPWDSLIGTPLNVEVMRDNILSNPIPITLAPAAPSAFTSDGVVAILTCQNGVPHAGDYCTLWGNGFGPTNPALQDGTPAPLSPLAYTAAPCTLEIGGASATVSYCGAAPGLIIYQMNFVYPAGVAANGSTAQAKITINGNTGNIVVPSA